MRAKRERFPHPNPNIHKAKKPLPDLLEYFQDEITIPWHHYCIENLVDLTIEFAQNELVSKIIPAAFEASNDIVSGEQDTHGLVRQCDGDKDHNGDKQETNDNNKHRLQRIKADYLATGCLHRASNILIYNLALAASTWILVQLSKENILC